MSRIVRMCVTAFVFLAAATTAGGPAPSPAGALTGPPPIKHVFVIVLENKTFDETFGPASPAPYLAKTLTSQGAFLRQYFGTAHLSLPNYIAMVSGQGPNADTQSDCQIYRDLVAPPVFDPNGQVVGQGCVYPSQVLTIADQLATKGLQWKGYMQDMATPCRHPALNAQDDTQKATKDSAYAARHNPFVYFHSIIDSPSCAANDVPLDRLGADLASVSTTPNFAFITPNLCADGHDPSCPDGRPGGLPGVDQFLQTWVPRIVNSPAYKQDGMLVVTFDESEFGGTNSDTAACCGELPGPNSPLPGITGLGGGRTGTVILSPWVAPGTVTDTPYNHYSMLRSFEDVFGLAHLGYAGVTGLTPFGADVYTGAGPTASATSTGGGAGEGGSAANAAGATNQGRGVLPATGRSTGPATAVAAGLVAIWLFARTVRRRSVRTART